MTAGCRTQDDFSLNRPGETGPVFWRMVFMGNSYRLFFSTSFLFVFLALFWQPQTSKPDELAKTGYVIPLETAAPTVPGPIYPTPTSPAPIAQAPSPPTDAAPTSLPEPTETPLPILEPQPTEEPHPTQEPVPTASPEPAVQEPAVQELDAPEPAVDEAFIEFIYQVVNGQPGLLTGVYVEDVLALPIIQQPERNYMFVSEEWGVITQFQSATRRGVTGLLAHNYLSGDLFFGLQIGHPVRLVYGDGTIREYIVEDIQSYEKLDKRSNNSDYLNVATGERLTTQQLFAIMYSGEDKVTFQTCIKQGSDWSWGRIFITAKPNG
jgi:hypothetical protein